MFSLIKFFLLSVLMVFSVFWREGKASFKTETAIRKETKKDLKAPKKPKLLSSKKKESVSSKNAQSRPSKKDLNSLEEREKKLNAIFHQYKNSNFFHIKFIKKLYLSFLEIEKESGGEFFYSQGKMRLETKSPEDLLVVLDGKFIWMEQRPPKGVSKKPRVIQMKWNEQNRSFNLFFSLFFNEEKKKRGSQKENLFKVLTYSKTKKEEKFEFKLRDKKSSLNINKVQLTFDRKRKEIKILSYKDELENLITYYFLEIHRKKKISKNHFLYTPPKGVNVIIH